MQRRPFHAFAACLLALLGCARERERTDGSVGARSAAAGPPHVATHSTAKPPASPRTLLELARSPYTTSLGVRGEQATLLTPDSLYPLGSGAAPLRFEPGELGVLSGTSVVRWSAGALRRYDPGAGDWSVLAKVSQPKLLVAHGAQLAWLQGELGAAASLWTLLGAEPRRVATAPLGVATMALRDDQLFFVEELAASRWRLGVVPLAGGAPRYGQPQSGRAPAMLAVTSEVFYYDGPTRSVYRAATDLQRAERLAEDVICSPLAAADKVYCAQPGALLELPLSGGPLRVVASPRGTVTALAATASELVWTREAGDGLAVDALAL